MPFSPTDVSGCKLWLKSDTGVYKDAGTTLAANNDTVQQWNDQSGNGNDYSQNTSGNRPTFLTGVLNGFPAISYTATRPDFFSRAINPLSGATAGEVFLVVKINTDPPSVDTKSGIWNWSSSDFDSHYCYTDSTIYEAFGTGTRKTVGNPTPSLSSTYRIYNVTSAAANYKARLDTTQLFTSGTNTVTFRSGTVTLGRSQNTTYNTDGRWVELIAYNKALSVTERGNVHSYLNDRYNLGVITKVTKTAGATAVLKASGVTKTGTVAAVIRKTGLTKTATASAKLVVRTTKTAGGTGVLRATLTKTATAAEVLLKQGIRKTDDVSALLFKTATKTVGATAVLLHRKTAEVSGVLRRTWLPFVTVDARLRKTVTRTATATAALIHVRTTAASAHLSRSGASTSFQIQSVIKATDTTSMSINAYLVPVRQFSFDAVTVRRTTTLATAHALLSKSKTKQTGSTGVLKKGAITSTFSLSGLLRSSLPKTAGATAILSGQTKKTTACSAYLLGTHPQTTQAIPTPSRIFEKDQ